jgi:two-component system, OmpR family, sensor histidine kinase KdpD
MRKEDNASAGAGLFDALAWGRVSPWLRYAVIVCAVAAPTAIYFRLLHVNPTTVALTFLLLIVTVASRWGFRYAVVMSLLSAAAFNYFFLPPVLKLTIMGSEDWIAFAAFLATGLGASRLAERARREAESANRRRAEIELLYALSQRLMLSENVIALVADIPGIVVETMGAEGAAVVLAGESQISRSHPEFQKDKDSALLALAMTPAEEAIAALEADRSLRSASLRLGLRRLGLLLVQHAQLSQETLDAAGSLIAISIERAKAVERLSRSEAARQSEELRNALLDSVTHEVRTPLTSMLAAVSSLRADAELNATERQELLSVVEEESLRLNRLIGDAVQMSALETNQVRLELQRESIDVAFDLGLERARPMLDGHRVDVDMDPDLPAVPMDVARIATVFQYLLENAAKYGAAETPIHVACRRDAGGGLCVTVSDRGPGIPEEEQPLIFEKFYRGRQTRNGVAGTGMGLAIAKAIVAAHGGVIAVTSRPGEGSTFSFVLPAGS